MCRGHFARVFVEIDLTKSIVAGTTVVMRGIKYWQPFIYESIAIFCFSCGLVGYRRHECMSPLRRETEKEFIMDGMSNSIH